MKIERIAVIGAGVMGGSVAKGIADSGYLTASAICMANPNAGKLEEFKSKGFCVTTNNKEAIKDADCIVLAVKPHLLKTVIDDLDGSLKASQAILSVAAGVSIKELEELLGQDNPIYRIMPNTAVSIRQSMTCISANKTGRKEVVLIKDMFDRLGKALVISDSQMDAATVLASCGIAYAFRYIRAAMLSGVEIGLKPDVAKELTLQTLKGAVELLENTGNHPEQEIDRVTTPKGVTIKGLNEMEHNGFSSSLIVGMQRAFESMT